MQLELLTQCLETYENLLWQEDTNLCPKMYDMKYQLKYVFIVDADTLRIIIYVQFSFVYKRRDCRQIT